MIANQRIALPALIIVLFLATACALTTGEPGIAQAPEIFIFPAATEEILISSEDIPQNNCDGSAEASQEVGREHTISRTLELGTGITVDAGGRAGIPGIGEVGVGAAVASHYQVGYGSEDAVRRVAIVAAKEGTNMLHTIRQYEIWETGELLISAAGVNQQIPYRFRKDFKLEMLPSANIGCPGQGAQPQQPTAELVTEATQPPSQLNSAPTEAVATQPLPTATPYCPFLTNSHIEQLRAVSSVTDALRQAEEFAGHQQNDYTSGATIPTGVVIATDLQNSDLSRFPVLPIRNQGGWGLFITTDAFAAPNAGTYWCIQ